MNNSFLQSIKFITFNWSLSTLKQRFPLAIMFPLAVMHTPSFCTNRVEFLFRVPLGIGALFRVGTLHSSIPLRITFRNCQCETQKHGSTCLLRITMSMEIIFRKICTKRKNRRKFLLCITFLGSSKCSDWFKLHRIVENFYSV